MNDLKIIRLDIDEYDVLFDNRHKLGVNFDEDMVTKIVPYKVKLYIDLHKNDKSIDVLQNVLDKVDLHENDKDINVLKNILDNDIEYILWEE